MQCRICGAPLKSGMNFCQMCGTKAAQLCPVCGAENDPSCSYCAACGYAINAETDVLVAPPSAPVGFTPPSADYGQTPASAASFGRSGYTQPNHGQGGYYTAPAYAPPVGQGGGSGRLRSVLGSTRMLVGSILLSISLVFLLFGSRGIASWILYSDVFDEIWDVAYMLDMEDALEVLVGIGTVGSALGFIKNLFAQWPLIVVIIGLWTTYAAAKNTGAAVMKEGGMSAIQTVGTILSVLNYIGLAFWALACIIAAVVASQSWFAPDELVGMCILFLFVGCGIFVFLAIFYKKVADTVKSLRLAIRTGQNGCAVSGFAFVVICIIAVCDAIGALIGIASVTALFSGGCQAAALFVFAGCLKHCKDPMYA